MTVLLILQGAPAPDTVAVARDMYDLVLVVAAAFVAAALVAVVVLLALVLAEVRRTVRSLEEAGNRIRTDPGLESLRTAAGHLESISGRVQDETDRLAGSVAGISDRIAQASTVIGERIADFDALLAALQREVESAFVGGAAAARGIHAGLDNLGGKRQRDRDGHRPEAGVNEGGASGSEGDTGVPEDGAGALGAGSAAEPLGEQP